MLFFKIIFRIDSWEKILAALLTTAWPLGSANTGGKLRHLWDPEQLKQYCGQPFGTPAVLCCGTHPEPGEMTPQYLSHCWNVREHTVDPDGAATQACTRLCVCVFYDSGGVLLGSGGLLPPWFSGSVCCFFGGTETPAERKQVQSAFCFVLSTVPTVLLPLSYHLSTFLPLLTLSATIPQHRFLLPHLPSPNKCTAQLHLEKQDCIFILKAG